MKNLREWKIFYEGMGVEISPYNTEDIDNSSTYNVSFEGKPLATIATSSPKGKSLLTTDLYYDITCEEKDLDLVFLVAFSIAKTEQTFYD